MKKSTIVLGLVSAFFAAKAVKSVVGYHSAKNKTGGLLEENAIFEEKLKQQKEEIEEKLKQQKEEIEEMQKVAEVRNEVVKEEIKFRESLTQEEVTQEWLYNKKLTPEIVKLNRAAKEAQLKRDESVSKLDDGFKID